MFVCLIDNPIPSELGTQLRANLHARVPRFMKLSR